MKLMDWIIFGGLALSAHVTLIAWAYEPHGGNTGSGGAQGADSVSVTAADQQMSNMIAKWTQTPEVMDDVPQSKQIPQLQPDQSTDLMTTDRVLIDPQVAPNQPARMIQTAQDPRPQAPETLTVPSVTRSDIAQIPTLPVQTESDTALPTVSTASTPDIQIPTFHQESPLKPAVAAPPQLDITSAEPIAAPVNQNVPSKRPKPRPSSIAQIAQTAKGTGTTSQAAVSSQSKSAPATNAEQKAKQQSDTTEWAKQIRNAIERTKFYPKGTRARGRVIIQVSVAPNGRLLNATVVQSSGFDVLDKAALAAVKRARFSKAPESLRKPRYDFRIPIRLAAN